MHLRSVPLTLLFFVLLAGDARGEKPADRTAFLRELVIQPGETVEDAICYFCSVRVRGTVSGDAVALWGSIEIEGKVEEDAVALGGGIRVRPGAIVGGDAVAVAGTVRRDDQGIITGELVSKPFIHLPGQRQLFAQGMLVFSAFMLALGVIVTLILRPRRIELVARVLNERRGATALVGIGMCVLACLLYYASFFSGRFVSFLLIAVFAFLFVTFSVGYAGVSMCLGQCCAAGRGPLLSVLSGSAVMTLCLFIPLLGILGALIVVLLALGAACLSRFGLAQRTSAT